MKALRLGIVVCLVGLMADTAAAQAQRAFSEKDLPDLLAHMQEKMTANYKMEQQYTSDEIAHSRGFDKNGKMTSEHTTKYENVVVEGLLYRHKVEHDGKPLSGKEAAEEEKHYEEAVAERRAMKSGRGLHLLWRTYQFDPPTSHLQTLFDNRVLRTEMVNGRETLVVESTPKPDAKPKNQGEKSSLDWKQTTWIDLKDAVPARTEMEQLHDHKSFLKGSTMKTDFSRRVEEAVDEGEPERAVWLQTETHWEMGVKIYWLRGSVKGETTWTNFKKFQVDMRLLEETMQEVPEAESR